MIGRVSGRRRIDADERHVNAAGTVHGGMLATLEQEGKSLVHALATFALVENGRRKAAE